MESAINIKELCKQIKFAGTRGSLIWGKEDSQNFITNRHFLVRFEVIPNEVLSALFGVFYKLPIVGETLNASFGKIVEQNESIGFKKIYRPVEQKIKGVVTQYSRDISKKISARVVKFPKHYSFVSSEFMSLLQINKLEDTIPYTSADNPNLPIYFADNNLLLLPFKWENNKISIEDLLGAELDEPVNPS